MAAKKEEEKKVGLPTSEGVKEEGQKIEDGVEDAKTEFKGNAIYSIEVKENGKWDLFRLERDGKKKVARTEKKDAAVTIRNNVLDKLDVEAARVVYGAFAKGVGFVKKRTEEEITKEQRAEQRKNEIPKELVELYGRDRAEQLQFMDENERGAVLHLLQQVRDKQEELNSFGVLAAQRSGFRKDEQKLKSLDKLKGKIAKAKAKLEQAKTEYETATDAGRTFAEKQVKLYPHLQRWIMEQLGVMETTAVNTKTRKRTGTGAENGKKALILKMFREQEGKGKRLKPSDISKIMKSKKFEGVWEQYAIANPIKSLKLDGYLAEDDERRYYIP